MQKLLNKIRFILFVIVLIVSYPVKAQSLKNDFEKIAISNFSNNSFHDHQPSFLLPNSKYLVIKYNPLSLFLGSLMYVYQSYFSKQFSAGCLFNPSCSNMSKQFISEFGLIKGFFLSADRLTRCNRIAATGVHPIRINQNDGKIHENAEMFRVKTKQK